MSDGPRLAQDHATELGNHWWWRPGWHIGTRFYAWHITFDDAPKLHRLTDFWQDRFRRFDYLDLVPRRWLHLTMQGVGTVEDVPDETRDQVVVAVQRRLAELSPVRVTFHHPVVRSEAIAMPPFPTSGVDSIRRSVRDGMADVIGIEAVTEQADGFQPHISLAYVNRDEPASAVVDTIDHADEPSVAAIDITHASLIEMHRDHRMYEWRTIATAVIKPDKAG